MFSLLSALDKPQHSLDIQYSSFTVNMKAYTSTFRYHLKNVLKCTINSSKSSIITAENTSNHFLLKFKSLFKIKLLHEFKKLIKQKLLKQPRKPHKPK